MKKNIAVVLSGCGVYDGSEIHEATLTLLAIARQGARYQCFAPDINQVHVVDHLSGDVTGEVRNVLTESARIARGDILPLSRFRAADFDAVIFPGGFGAAKNLSTFASQGAGCTVHPDVEMTVTSMAKAGKPIGALCISPVILARILKGVEVTIGNDPGTASAISSMGGKHIDRLQGEIVIDTMHKVVTTPCYMLDASIVQIAESADLVVKTLLTLM